jgi:uncharacterized protein (DUF433 family)
MVAFLSRILWETAVISDRVPFDRITFDLRIMAGRACIRGLRIPVSVIVGQIAGGASAEQILADYPDLEAEDIQQALAYAAWLTREEVIPA